MPKQSRVVKTHEGKWMFDRGPHLVSMSCHHKREGACGGCYARVIQTLQDLKTTEAPISMVEALLEEIKSEAK